MRFNMDEVQDRILQEALELFSEKGAVETYMKDIAEEVGVRETTIYYYFDGKDGILDELTVRHNEKMALILNQALKSVYAVRHYGKITREIIRFILNAHLLNAHLERLISVDNFHYERIMDVEKFRNPHSGKLHYEQVETRPQRTFELILLTIQYSGMLPDDFDVSRMAEICHYIFRASIEKHLLLGDATDETLLACRDNILDDILFLYDRYAVADEVPVRDDACVFYGSEIVRERPGMMKWIVLSFQDYGIMDEFVDKLADDDALYELARKKQQELLALGPETYAETPFDDSLHFEHWREMMDAPDFSELTDLP